MRWRSQHLPSFGPSLPQLANRPPSRLDATSRTEPTVPSPTSRFILQALRRSHPSRRAYSSRSKLLRIFEPEHGRTDEEWSSTILGWVEITLSAPLHGE